MIGNQANFLARAWPCEDNLALVSDRPLFSEESFQIRYQIWQLMNKIFRLTYYAIDFILILLLQ